MTKKYKLFLLILILATMLILNIFALKSFFLSSHKKVSVDFNIGEHFGFNPEPDALHFGTLLKGAIGFRDFEIYNTDCNKCIVTLKSDIKWLTVSENNFIMKKNQKKSINIYLSVPKDAEAGAYNGSVNLYLWKTI